MTKPIIRNIDNGDKYDFCIGNRVKFKVPERGGYGLGFGKVLKINKKTLVVNDEKYEPGRDLIVDKGLVFEEIIFNNACDIKRENSNKRGNQKIE